MCVCVCVCVCVVVVVVVVVVVWLFFTIMLIYYDSKHYLFLNLHEPFSIALNADIHARVSIPARTPSAYSWSNPTILVFQKP